MVLHLINRKAGAWLVAILNCGACGASNRQVCASKPENAGTRESNDSSELDEKPTQFERPLLSLANCPARPLHQMQVEFEQQVVHDVRCDKTLKIKMSYSKMCAVAEALVNVEAFSHAAVLMVIPDDAVTAMYYDTSLDLRASALAKGAGAIAFVDAHGAVVLQEDSTTSYFQVEPRWSQDRFALRLCGRTSI